MNKCLIILLLMFAIQPAWGQEAPTAGQVAAVESASLRSLTLENAIDLALKNNLNIEIERFNPALRETLIFTELSRFDPLFSANVNLNDATQPSGSRLQGSDQLNNENLDYNASLQHQLKTGTFYNVTFNNARIRTNQLFTSVNPRYDSSLFASVTQPLMRNFGTEITMTPIRIAETNRFAADARLRQQMLDIVLQVEQAYWDLVFARRELEVRRQSLEFAQDLYENNKKQVEVGTMAPLEVVVAEAEVAAREEGIITTEALIRNTEDRLRNLILPSADTLPVTAETSEDLVPSEEPVVDPTIMSEDEAIRRAMENNPDLKALARDLEASNLNLKLAHNALKPQVDLKASYGYTGLGGERLLVDNSDPFNPVVIGTTPGGYFDAVGNMFDNRTWSVGLVIGLPLKNRAAEAGYVRADISQKQSERIFENAKKQLELNIRITMRNLQSDLKRLDAARASRVLQEKKLDAERKKLNVGLSTNHIVLDFQEDLAQARSAELRAMVDYSKDIAQLERYMGDNLPQ